MGQIAEVIKYEGDNSTFIWKHPSEDFNSLTQLIVHESQEAVFMMNGEALDVFGPGRYTLETQNIPLISSSLDKITKDRKSGTPFHCEVYFINHSVQMALKWGTDSHVRYLDPSLGFPLEIGASGDMNLRVTDSRKLLVKLVGTMKGIAWEQQGDGFTKSLKDSFKPLISTAVKANLANALKDMNIDILEVDAHLVELSESLRQAVIPGFEEYGLTIPEFYLTNVLLPENDPNFRTYRNLHSIELSKKKAEAESGLRQAQYRAEADANIVKAQTDAEVTAERRKAVMEEKTTEIEVAKKEAEKKIIETQAEAQAKAITGEGEAQYTRSTGFAEADVMKAQGYSKKDILQADVQKAYAEGLGQFGANAGAGGGGGNSTMGDIMGIGIGLQAANAMGKQMGSMFEGMNTSEQTDTAAETIKCAACGKDLPAGAKFCLECGAKVVSLAEDEMICPSCGQKTPKGKFCMECGAALSRKCPKCGADVPVGGKFCLECGERL